MGEALNGIPNNLMSYVTQVAKEKLEKLRVFGNTILLWMAQGLEIIFM